MKIDHGGLREAYEGYYEDDSDVIAEYEAWVQEQIREAGKSVAVKSYEWWLEDWCAARCSRDTPEQRLEIYCHWNGIIGWSSILYHIATKEVMS